MKIRLNEIPTDGRSYTLNRETAELNKTLQDLLQKSNYQVDVYIRPINSKDFQISGVVKTQLPEVCSRCGDDFSMTIDKKINDILIEQPEDDRTGRYAKTLNTALESEGTEELSVSHYKDDQFDLGEYIHEAIALEIPFNPAPPCSTNGDCTVCHKNFKEKKVFYDEIMSEEIKSNPFEALKNIKLN